MRRDPAHYLPALDGVRALAIVLVILGHLAGTRNMPLEASRTTSICATLGVRIFFVLSGFLITTLILAEHRRTGSVSLRSFYARRAYRIFPAFYTYLAVVSVLAVLGFVSLLHGDLLAAATYTMNFHRPRAWYFGHLWSLSVEEQFYLAWPAVFLALERRGAMIVAGLVTAAGPLARVGVWVLAAGHRDGIGETFPTVFDALAAGCLLAGVRQALALSRRYTAFSRSPLFAVVPLAVVLAAAVPRVSFQFALGESIQNVGVALTIDWLVRCHPTPAARMFGRIFDAPAIVWLGRISYSLYLWQQPFLNRAGTWWAQAFPVNLGAAFAAAILSFYLVERPFLRLREQRTRANRTLAPVAVHEADGAGGQTLSVS